MNSSRRPPYRPWLLVVSGVLLIVGAWMHPRDPGMAAMMLNRNWLPSHLAGLVGVAGLLAWLVLVHRSGTGPAGHWLPLAIGAAALQSVEAFFHLISMVDAHRLESGGPTVLLDIHLFLTPITYPLFTLAMIALIAAGARSGTLGNWWIAPLGMLGVALPGAASILVVVLDYPLGFLFAGIMLFGLWAVVAALLPVRSPVPAAATPGMRGRPVGV